MPLYIHPFTQCQDFGKLRQKDIPTPFSVKDARTYFHKKWFRPFFNRGHPQHHFYSVKLLHPYLYRGYHRGQSRVLFVVSKFTAVTPLCQILKFQIKNQNFKFELIQIWFFGLISFSVLALFSFSNQHSAFLLHSIGHGFQASWDKVKSAW